MDRPTEEFPPEPPADDCQAPSESGNPSASGNPVQADIPADEVERIDPHRAVLFRRFDAPTAGLRKPSFDREIRDESGLKSNPHSEDTAASSSEQDGTNPEASQPTNPERDERNASERNKSECNQKQQTGTEPETAGELDWEPRSGRDDELILIQPVVDLTSRPTKTSLPSKSRHQGRRNDPVLHGLVMLATVFAVLAAARFVLPGIIEEIRYAQHRGQLRAEFEVAGDGLRNVSLDALSQAYQMVSAAAGPSVVHIDIHRTTHESIVHPDLPGAPTILISDQGSGVVVDADGYVLTNRHVVATSDEISVTLSDGRIVDAEVVGTDELTDLAVLKVQADNLIPIRWGDSERIRVGSPVWAIGSPFGLDRTITFGILSGKHRVVRARDRYQDFMQSDVAVNPGNSGGPLVDSRGTMIGINTAIVGETYQGVSFAIPSDVAQKIYLRLRETGEIQRGWLGVSLSEVPDDQLSGANHRVRGAMIVALADPDSGAARAGLQAGDIVVRVDSEPVRDVDHLMQVIGNAMAGTSVQLAVVRNREELNFAVSLGRRPGPAGRR